MSSLRDLCNAADDDCTKLGMIFYFSSTGNSGEITLEPTKPNEADETTLLHHSFI